MFATQTWVTCSGGQVPPNALAVGSYFVGRTSHNGSTIFGKVHPANGAFYYSWGGKELNVSTYEVLVIGTYTKVSWISASRGNLPNIPVGSTIVGDDAQGVWVAACYLFDNHRIPGSYFRCDANAYFAYNKKEESRDVYDVLVVTPVTHAWVQVSGSAVPSGALAVGSYFVGRTSHNGSTIFGKVYPPHSSLYYPSGGKELRVSTYEVLVINTNTKVSWILTSHGNLPNVPVGSTIISDNAQSVWVTACYLSDNHRIPGSYFRCNPNAYFANGVEENRDVYDVLVITPMSHAWVKASSDSVPSGALAVGRYFVGRTSHNGSTIFGKVHPAHGFYYSFGGKEFKVSTYEVLVINTDTEISWIPTSRGNLPNVPAGSTIIGDDAQGVWVTACYLSDNHRIPGSYFRCNNKAYFANLKKEESRDVYDVLAVASVTHAWIEASGGAVPSGALAVGTYFVGRTSHNGSTIFGKVHPACGVLYYSSGAKELKVSTYEVLVINTNIKVSWIPASRGNLRNVPIGSTIIGDDAQGVWVAACDLFDNHRIPGSYFRGDTNARFAYGTKEESKDVYDILVITPMTSPTHLWVEDSDGHVPSGAVQVGHCFVGRTKRNGSTIYGKVVPSQGVLYYPFNGQELNVKNYEVLITTPGTKVSWIPAGLNGTPPTYLPRDSFLFGGGRDGTWIIAATWENSLEIPGMYIHGHSKAYIPHYGEKQVADFKFLALTSN
ncbi:hypothetical protein BC938DRAFT_472244 [Jimgerdemannia flammicorona]|uniref:Uncharacterized protein n=1 Tax=Jimgerdemannia flammicorona TaxID=994334 RepID=A0A433Q6I0_9FUNG|nr:hypothetical protein BC938DRAFT_472244 [Jimgerdemannia flammicorona]